MTPARIVTVLLTLGISLATTTVRAGRIATYLFDGTAGTATPATVVEDGGDTSVDLPLGGPSEYSADTPFTYAGNTSLNVSSAVHARAWHATQATFQFANTAAWSIGVWFKTTTDGTQQIVSHRKAGTGNGYSVGLLSGGKGIVSFQGQTAGDGRAALGATTGLNDGTWHMLLGVSDPTQDADGQMRLYVDGVPDGSHHKTQTETIDYGNSYFSVGCGYDASTGGYNSYGGLLDEVTIHDHALTDAEALALYAHSVTYVPAGSPLGLLAVGGLLLLGRRRRR